MSNVVKGTRGPGRLRAAVNLTLGCVLLGGCSAGSDRFSSASFGSGYGARRASAKPRRLPRICGQLPRQPAQSPGPAYLPAAAPAYRLPAPAAGAGGYQLASASPNQTNSYLQASRVDLPPLPQRQPAQGTKMADGYGPYNQPPPSGRHLYRPAGLHALRWAQRRSLRLRRLYPEGGDPRGTTAAHRRLRRPDYYRRSDDSRRRLPMRRGTRRVFTNPSPIAAMRTSRLTMETRAPPMAALRRPMRSASHRSWSGRTDGEMVAVAPGDTLYTLARRYGVTVDMIARANGLSTRLRPARHKAVHSPRRSGFLRAGPVAVPRLPKPSRTRSRRPAAKDQSRQAACFGGEADAGTLLASGQDLKAALRPARPSWRTRADSSAERARSGPACA